MNVMPVNSGLTGGLTLDFAFKSELGITIYNRELRIVWKSSEIYPFYQGLPLTFIGPFSESDGLCWALDICKKECYTTSGPFCR